MAYIIFIGLVLLVLLFLFIFPTARKSIQDRQDQQLFIPAAKVHPLGKRKMELKMNDNGGNRTGIDRRIFEYSVCIPERRSGRDRRKGNDRRNSMVRRRKSERRQAFKMQLLN